VSTALAPIGAALPATSPESLAKLVRVEDLLSQCAQHEVATEHVLHAGMYSRSIRLEPGEVVTGCLYKVPNLVIVAGHCQVLADDEWVELLGYHVLPGSAGRKSAFVALSTTVLTMLFATRAQTVEEAENEMTDEADRLMSRQSSNDIVIITGE